MLPAHLFFVLLDLHTSPSLSSYIRDVDWKFFPQEEKGSRSLPGDTDTSGVAARPVEILSLTDQSTRTFRRRGLGISGHLGQKGRMISRALRRAVDLVMYGAEPSWSALPFPQLRPRRGLIILQSSPLPWGPSNVHRTALARGSSSCLCLLQMSWVFSSSGVIFCIVLSAVILDWSFCQGCSEVRGIEEDWQACELLLHPSVERLEFVCCDSDHAQWDNPAWGTGDPR